MEDLKQYNPDGSPLRCHQLQLLELLREFDRICRLEGIVWWLDSGTLIGAVRHGGFIPWDDDLDVCILVRDIPKLRKLMRRQARPPYAFKVRGDKGYTRLWPRFINTNSRIVRRDDATGKPMEDFIWIDANPLRPGSPGLKRLADASYGRIMRRISGAINDGLANKILAYVLYPFSLLIAASVSLFGWLFHSDTFVFDYGLSFYSTRIRKDIFPLTTVEFEGFSFPAPADTDAYLRRIYVDWTKLPPEEKRRNHEIIFPD